MFSIAFSHGKHNTNMKRFCWQDVHRLLTVASTFGKLKLKVTLLTACEFVSATHLLLFYGNGTCITLKCSTFLIYFCKENCFLALHLQHVVEYFCAQKCWVKCCVPSSGVHACFAVARRFLRGRAWDCSTFGVLNGVVTHVCGVTSDGLR